MREQGIGASVLRKEDRRFLTGRGRFVGDIDVAGAVCARIVRSPHAHARIRGIDVTRAEAVPGIVAVLTGADMAGDGIGAMPCLWAVTSKDGTAMAEPPRWALARFTVRHVGEPMAVVVAETPDQAADGAKGVGESGTIGAPAAVIGAILDALAPLGVRDIEMPATASRVWRAIRDAGHG